MVLVNNEEISIYKLDSENSLKIRISEHMKTLPKYLSGIDALDLTNLPKKLKVVDILQLIKNDSEKNTDFATFLGKLPTTSLDVKNDILLPWLVYNKEIATLSEYSPIVLDSFATTFTESGYFPSENDFLQFWKTGRESVKKDLEIKIKQIASENKKYTELYKIFENIEDGLGYTEFKTERVMLNMNLDLKSITPLEIFNYIVLTESIPFAVCKKYYKILKDFIPSEEWAMNYENTDDILLKMNEKPIVDTTKFKDYTDVKISVSGDIGSENVEVFMKLITERGYLSRDQFIDRFFTSFKTKINYTNIDETEVLGIFYFPQERINTYVFSDLVMNNILFSSLVNIDESSKSTKKKSEGSQPWIYIHFNHPSTGHVTASITQKLVNRSEPIMREEDPDIFPHGQPYIRVRAKGRDMKSIQFFQEMFSKLLVIYNQKHNEIVEIYEQFIPDFGVIEEFEVPDLKQSDMAPDIFVSNFSRYCSEMRYPTIVTDKKAKKYKAQGKEVMVFPRGIEGNEKSPIPSDGKNQHNFVCLNPEYPYPGLQINNKLSNADEYPYLPCCFKNEQSSKPGGIYRHYYFGEDLEVKDKKQQDLITTDKILGNDKYGTLPDDLQKLFEVLDTDTKYKYIRMGVHRNYSSLLNAVMVALNEQTNILDIPDESRRARRLKEVRKELSSIENSAMARQCCYDVSQSQISDNLKNTDVYMDPKLYAQLLEGYFNCNIFIFNREKMIMPRFTQSYYKNRRESPCIFIYEHWGSKSDNTKYPQCEIIVRWNVTKKEDIEYSFPYDSKISRSINKVFRLLNESYVLDKKIQEIIFPIVDQDIRIISQTIDSYGKTRCINIDFKGERLSLLTTPIPPLPIRESSDGESEIMKVSRKTALSFFKKIGVAPISQNLDSPNRLRIIQLNSIFGNVNISIPVTEDDAMPELRSIFGVSYPQDNISYLSIFNKNKKIARYVTEYLFWCFSRYIQSNNIEIITDKVLAKFAKESFTINPNHEYQNVPKNFSLNNTIMDNGKIIVKNEETIKRLMYVLKLYSVRDIKTLRSYHTRTSITHYYVDITDFDYYPEQVILQGEDSIDKWIQESKFSLTLHSDIVIGQYTPYFFKNTIIDENKVFLAQNTNSLEMAMAIGVSWQKQKYNSGLDTDVVAKKQEFKLYSYVNSENIVSYEVSGKPVEKQIKIVGYKLGDSAFYTVLLELE